LSSPVNIPDNEIEIHAIRASGAGGQHVNKVSSAIHLRFDIRASSLPETFRARLLQLKDSRVSTSGVIIIKAQQFRSREKNRADALNRLHKLISEAITVPRKRRATRKSGSSIKRRLERKTRHGQLKSLRKRVTE